MSTVVLADLVVEVTSGDWGNAEPIDGTEECSVVRGTDFQRLAEADVSQAPHRFIKRSSVLKRRVAPGDLLVEMSGGSEAQPTGRLVRVTDGVTKIEMPVIFSNFVKRLRVTDDVDSSYFALSWESLYRQGKTRPYEKRTTGIRNFRLDDFLSSESIPLPRIAEQHRIVRILSTIDQASRASRNLLTQARILRQSCVRHLFALAADWPTMRLGDLARTSSGGTPRRDSPGFYGGSIPWLKSGEVRDNTILATEEHITEAGLAASSAKVFPVGTLLMAMYGATAGQVGILGLAATTNQAICAIFPTNQVTTEYLFFALQEARGRLRAERYGGAQPNLSQQTIQNFELSIPPHHVQEQIVSALSVVDNYIQSASGKDRSLATTFSAVLSELLVNEAVA